MLKKFVSILGGDPNKRAVDKLSQVVDQINSLEAEYEALSDEELRGHTESFRQRLQADETLDDLLPEAFATVREASKRTIGLRHYDVQLLGGMALHQGRISEMRTGEGKTLVATLPVYLNALTGRGVHLITVNDYLARRDARWMAPIYHLLGLSVGVLQMAARTENGKKAFLIDLEKTSPHEDQHQLRMVPRIEAYAADVTYGTNSEFGFDYLRDNMTMRLDDRVQRGHYYAIVDEVDNVLIDEARTPLIISGPAQEDTEWYVRMAQIVRQLRPDDYELSERDRTVTLSEVGEIHVEELLGIPLRDPDRPEDVTPEQARLMGYLEQALRAQFLFRRNKDYLVQAGKVIIIDEFTGRLMPGRRWSDGLHQAVEAKEGAKVQAENMTYATITIQNYFRMYEKLAGMTGTALTEAEEFDKIYKLEVLSIPTNLEYQAARSESGLVLLEDKDEQGYKYRYYGRREDINKSPVYWQRKDYPDVIYRTEEAKFRAITSEILCYHVLGRPMLVGTTSVELSDRLSSRLRAEPLRKLALVFLLRQAWFKANDRVEDGRLVSELQPLNAPLDQLQISDLRKMARDLNISSSVEDPENLTKLLEILELGPQQRERLLASLQGGIPHQVLNARKHTEESQIIAGAGAFGAVTIATNMAGRGVDIKLGGELAEEVIDAINRVLRRAGFSNPYDLRMEERRQALLTLKPEQYGIYEAEIQHFLQYMGDMERVKELGGLHVIGSERHEARRIDNQLRGRAARQGDPGSSRFYLSLQDELMARFGGEQANNLMQRFQVDDAMPMEIGIVGRLVEQSQTRVEGANFDMRKHLLEYDDVLNAQRQRIYSQRDLIFTKPDLSEDVTEMLRSEVQRRVPEALKDKDGPWKLLAWLDQIQPPISVGGLIFPSYSLKLLVQHLESQKAAGDVSSLQEALLGLVSDAIKAEEDHLLHVVDTLLENARLRLDEQIMERQQALDTFFEGLEIGDGEGTAQRSPREILDEAGNIVHLPLKLTSEEMRLLRDDPRQVEEALRQQVASALINQSITRLVSAVERRLEESLELAQLSSDWEALAEQISNALVIVLERRRERLLGSGEGPAEGAIQRDLESAINKIEGPLTSSHLAGLLIMLPQGTRAAFDKKTHRRVLHRTTRLTYTYYAAQLLEGRNPQEITDDVLKHLEAAQGMLRRTYGLNEFARLAGYRMDELDETAQRALCTVLGEDTCRQLQGQPLQSLGRDETLKVIDELGRMALTTIYRWLLLRVITELWVDYLTQMEALRVSIGLEAYAQRDPLVQYKSKASELFQTLLSNMRLGVVNGMFTYRAGNVSNVQAEARRASMIDQPAELESQVEPTQAEEADLPETEEDAGSAPEEAPTQKATLSRSQKRHKKRR